jgi:D-serine/D-alanine/glycine transporter
MRAMGELLLSNLHYKSFADFCADYIGPWAGFFIGWSYWLTWVVGVIGECVIIGGYAQFWWPELPAWIPAMATIIILLSLNVLAVKAFGELEFWFAIIKIVAIICLIAAGSYLVMTGFRGPDGVQASLDNLLDKDVFMPHGIMGFFAGFQIAIFSFAGIELIGTTAAETKNPEKNLPRAINAVPVRILVFYVLSIASIIAVSSWSKVSPSHSPFVQLFATAGFPMAAAAVNLVVTLSAMSSANSGVFSTSRMIYGLSLEKDAPEFFRKLSRSIPIRGLLLSTGCMMAGLGLLFFVPNIMSAFTLLSTIGAVLYIFVWSMILVAYILYRKKRPDLHATSVFKMPGGVKMAYCCLGFYAFVIVLLSLDKDTLDGLKAMPVWFILLGVAYSRIKKTERYKTMVSGNKKLL